MFRNSLFALGAATIVLAGTPLASKADIVTYNVNSAGSFLIGSDQAMYFSVNATCTDTGSWSSTFGKITLILAAGDQTYTVNTVASSMVLDSSETCKVTGNTNFRGIPAKVEAYLSKSINGNQLGWRILRRADNAVLTESGREEDGSLKMFSYDNGKLALSSSR